MILGTGSYLPDFVLKNDDFTSFIETSDEWIHSHTGISERRINTGLANWEMGERAARQAMSSAGLGPDDIDMLIVSTGTPDFFTPSTACVLQGRLGIAQGFAFDISAACSGFLYALDMADSYIRCGKARNVLLVAAETLSRVTDFNDRNTCVLFADGAAAVVYGETPEGSGLLSSYLSSRGELWDIIVADAFKTRNVFDEEHRFTGGNQLADNPGIHWNGHEVYKFATRVVPAMLDEVCERARTKIDDVKLFFFHQANERIIRTVIEKYNLVKERCVMAIERTGNISSATIPYMLDMASRDGRLKRGELIAMCGFGAGMTAGAALMRW